MHFQYFECNTPVLAREGYKKNVLLKFKCLNCTMLLRNLNISMAVDWFVGDEEK